MELLLHLFGVARISSCLIDVLTLILDLIIIQLIGIDGTANFHIYYENENLRLVDCMANHFYYANDAILS